MGSVGKMARMGASVVENCHQESRGRQEEKQFSQFYCAFSCSVCTRLAAAL